MLFGLLLPCQCVWSAKSYAHICGQNWSQLNQSALIPSCMLVISPLFYREIHEFWYKAPVLLRHERDEDL